MLSLTTPPPPKLLHLKPNETTTTTTNTATNASDGSKNLHRDSSFPPSPFLAFPPSPSCLSLSLSLPLQPPTQPHTNPGLVLASPPPLGTSPSTGEARARKLLVTSTAQKCESPIAGAPPTFANRAAKTSYKRWSGVLLASGLG